MFRLEPPLWNAKIKMVILKGHKSGGDTIEGMGSRGLLRILWVNDCMVSTTTTNNYIICYHVDKHMLWQSVTSRDKRAVFIVLSCAMPPYISRDQPLRPYHPQREKYESVPSCRYLAGPALSLPPYIDWPPLMCLQPAAKSVPSWNRYLAGLFFRRKISNVWFYLNFTKKIPCTAEKVVRRRPC